MDEQGIYRAKHILLLTVDMDTREPLDEETIAKKKETAAQLLDQLRAAEDPIALFDQLMNEHSEDWPRIQLAILPARARWWRPLRRGRWP